MADEIIETHPDESGGEPRKLATLVPTTSGPLEYKTVFGEMGSGVLIPRSQWKPISFRQYFPRIKDQNGIGMCGASAGGNLVEGTKRLAGGQADVDLSAGDLYRRVSGGRDSGSLPEDVLRECMVGIAPVSDVKYLDWHSKVNSPTRNQNRVTEAWWCPTVDHAGSAIQQGFIIHGSSWWFQRDPLDADGWLKPEGSGRRGGHSYALCGMATKGGRWAFEFPNSWTVQWGDQGFGFSPEERIDVGTKVFQLWACRATVQQGGNIPAPTE